MDLGSEGNYFTQGMSQVLLTERESLRDPFIKIWLEGHQVSYISVLINLAISMILSLQH